jgi:hypothetical protein
MMKLRVTANITNVQKYLGRLGDKQIRYATAVALTRTAKQAQSEVRTTMTRVFDRPTPYALNATRVKPATKATLQAEVLLKDKHGDPQSKDVNFLYPEVFGTPRGRKAFETRLMRVGWLRSNEFVVPATDLPLDPFGNVPTGMLRSILSQAGAAGGPGYSSNKSSSLRSKRTVAKRGTFFVPDPKSSLPRGIYQRRASGFGTLTRMIFKIVVGKPRYRPRLRLTEIVNRVVRRDFQREFARAYREAEATAR